MRSELIHIYRYINSFVPMNETEWNEFECRVTIKRVQQGENLFSAGQVCNHVCFINSGAARMYYVKEHEDVNAYFGFENSFVCDYQSFLTREHSKYFIQALEDCELVMIPYETVHYGYENFHNWNKFGRLITEHFYIQVERRAESFLFKSAEERYIELVQTFPDIFERVPLYHLASYLGIKGPSLSRIRRRVLKPVIG
jgi:CRP-like cAMP-binding protein